MLMKPQQRRQLPAARAHLLDVASPATRPRARHGLACHVPPGARVQALGRAGQEGGTGGAGPGRRGGGGPRGPWREVKLVGARVALLQALRE